MPPKAGRRAIPSGVPIDPLAPPPRAFEPAEDTQETQSRSPSQNPQQQGTSLGSIPSFLDDIASTDQGVTAIKPDRPQPGPPLLRSEETVPTGNHIEEDLVDSLRQLELELEQSRQRTLALQSAETLAAQERDKSRASLDAQVAAAKLELEQLKAQEQGQKTALQARARTTTSAPDVQVEVQPLKEQMLQERMSLTQQVENLRTEVAELEAAFQSSREQLKADISNRLKPENVCNAQFQLLLSDIKPRFTSFVSQNTSSAVADSLRRVFSGKILASQRLALRRKEAFSDFKSRRAEDFASFLKVRQRGLHDTFDATFSSLRKKREDQVTSLKHAITEMNAERDKLSDAELRQSKVLYQRTYDASTERQLSHLRSTSESCEQREKDLLNRQEMQEAHSRKLRKEELFSAEQRLKQEEAFALTVSAAKKDVEGPIILRLDQLRAQVRQLQESWAVPRGSSLRPMLQNGANRDERDPHQAIRSILNRRLLETTTASERLRNLCDSVHETISRMSASSLDDRTKVLALQNRFDTVRTSWERSHREFLFGRSIVQSQLSQDGAYLTVFDGLAGMSSLLLQRLKGIKEERSDLEKQMEAWRRSVDDNRRTSIETAGLLFSRYEELAALAARVEQRERQLAMEGNELLNAQQALESDLVAFEEEGRELQLLSAALQTEAESAAVERAKSAQALVFSEAWHNQHFVKPERTNRSSRTRNNEPRASEFLKEFSALLKVTSDDDNRGRMVPSASEGYSSTDSRGKNSLTTPSPDSDSTPSATGRH